mmetsp:Transcript_5043/g.10264  ORF Transcript_5043/g.10264 Transcript_5043/m.10264 type:complete len:410 (+) Transcript_5043:696-1925(+)
MSHVSRRCYRLSCRVLPQQVFCLSWLPSRRMNACVTLLHDDMLCTEVGLGLEMHHTVQAQPSWWVLASCLKSPRRQRFQFSAASSTTPQAPLAASVQPTPTPSSVAVCAALSPALLRHRPVARVLDPEVVDAACQPEPAVLAPVGAPRVPPDPELLPAFALPVPCDGDFVHLRSAVCRVVENAPRVGLELLCDAHPACDRAPGCDFRHHRVLTLDLAVGLDAPLGVVADLETHRRHPEALELTVLTRPLRVALAVLGRVLLARHVRYAVRFHPREGCRRVAAAAAVGLVGGDAIDEDLRGEIDLGERPVPQDVDPVAHGAGGALRPTAPTVHGDVLVLVDGSKVLASHVTHVVRLRQRVQRRERVQRRLRYLEPCRALQARLVVVVVGPLPDVRVRPESSRLGAEVWGQ